MNGEGEVVMDKPDPGSSRIPDQFEAVRGKADVKWCTEDLMAQLRSEG